MKKALLFITLLLCVTILAACGNTNDDVLKIGTSPDYPPFESLDESGNLVGFDIEMMDAVAKIMDVEIEYQQLDFSVIISSMNSGQVDLGVSGFTYDPERVVLFSTPYYMSAQAAVVATGSDITTVADLEGKRVSAGLGTTGESAAMEIPNVEMINPDDYMVGFEMLKNGQTDAVVCDYGVALNFDAQDEFTMLEDYLTSEEMSIIAKDDNTELMEKINAAIEEFKATDEYTALLEKYELN